MSSMISASLLPEFDYETATTRKLLDRFADGLVAWQPHEKSMSMGRLASHLADIPSWVEFTLHKDEIDLMPPDGSTFETPQLSTREELLASFDANCAKARAALESTDDARMMTNWSMLMGGQTMFTMPKIAVLRTWVFNHLIHHRAQMSVYLRLNDIPVPGIYGPSADDQGM